MIGPKREARAAVFYEFSLEVYTPQDHLLYANDRFVHPDDIRHVWQTIKARHAAYPLPDSALKCIRGD